MDAVKDVLSQLPSENLALIRVIVELLRQVSNMACVCVCACVCVRACVHIYSKVPNLKH